MVRDPLSDCIGFEWDESNVVKNWERHHVTPEEAEDAFFHDPFIVRQDTKHSPKEVRYRALGTTSRGRLLMMAFIVRRKRVRVISVRDMNRREAQEYKRHEENS